MIPMLAAAVDRDFLIECVQEITETDRWNSFDRFHETTGRLLQRWKEIGADTEVHTIQTGGPAGDGRWRIQEAYDIRAGTVDVVRPVSMRIADYRENPWSVIHWSTATPEKGIEGELVVIDSWEELAAMAEDALTGKIVLTRLSPYHKSHAWTAHGSRVLLCDMPVDNLPGATKWGKFGWGGLDIEHAAERPAGFMLSADRGCELRTLLEKHGRLVLHAHLDVRRYTGTHDVVSGLLRGTDDPQDEVWALAHGAEPGAVDNASGVAACIEAVRLLKTLIDHGRIPPPKRTIRCLAGFECYGFFAYLAHVRRFQPPLAGLVVDCVGVKPGACDGTLPWHATVPGSAEFVDAVGFPMLEAALKATDSPCTPAFKPFVSTEDTMIGDPRYGFPCPYLGTFPYRGYHSSGDTLDLIDPATLAAAAIATAGYLYYFADADSRQVQELAIAHTRTVIEPELSNAGSADKCKFLCARHTATLTRLQRWMWGGDRRAILAALQACNRKSTASAAAAGPRPPEQGADVAHSVPFRRYPLAPTYENVWPAVRDRINESGIPKWTLYWADGNRTIEDIRRLVGADRGKTYTVEQVHAFFMALDEIGYVRLVRPEDLVPREQLAADLHALGLEPGMDIMVHSSLSRIGWVKGGASTVIDALLDILGPDSTLLMPSFNHRAADVFNPLTTPTTNGAIPDAFWRRPDVHRSRHPTHAVAAVGPKAESWLRDHVEVGIWAAESPIGRLIHNGGWILGLGVDHTSSTAYHVGEVSLNVPCLDQFASPARLVDTDGSVRTVPCLAWRNGVCPVSPKHISETLDAKKKQRCGKVGRADCVLARAIDVWATRREQIRPVCPTCEIRPVP